MTHRQTHPNTAPHQRVHGSVTDPSIITLIVTHHNNNSTTEPLHQAMDSMQQAGLAKGSPKDG